MSYPGFKPRRTFAEAQREAQRERYENAQALLGRARNKSWKQKLLALTPSITDVVLSRRKVKVKRGRGGRR